MEKTNENPITKHKLARKTSFLDSFSFFETSEKEVFARNVKYAGIRGRMHGLKNETMPAKNEKKIVGCVIKINQ
jgi:hypothetical protein